MGFTTLINHQRVGNHMQDTNDTFSAVHGSAGRRSRDALIAGVAVACASVFSAALPRAASAQQQPNLGVAPVKLQRHAVRIRHGRAARHQGVDRRARSRASVQPRVPAERRRARDGARRGLARSCTTRRSGKGAASLDPQPVAGIPAQQASRGAGVNEVVLHPKFAENRWVYFTYNKTGEPIPDTKPPRRQSAVALGRGKFDGKALTNVEEIFVGNWSAERARLAARVRQRRPAVHDHRRGVRRQRAAARHGLRQSAAPHRRRQAREGQSVRGEGRRARRDLLVRPSRPARPHGRSRRAAACSRPSTARTAATRST